MAVKKEKEADDQEKQSEENDEATDTKKSTQKSAAPDKASAAPKEKDDNVEEGQIQEMQSEPNKDKSKKGLRASSASTNKNSSPEIASKKSEVEPRKIHIVDPEEQGIPRMGNMLLYSASARAIFVRKVFALVTLMLFTCALMCSITVLWDKAREWFIVHYWIFYIALIFFLVTYLLLVCISKVRKTYPWNYFALSIFTLSAGFMLMVMTAISSPQAVLLALGTTTLTCVAIIIFACQTRIDITKWGFLLFVACISLLIFGLVLSIMSLFMSWQTMKILHIIFAALATVLFMVYLAYDVQMIMGGRRHEIAPDEHVYAALQLFMDIYQIFSNLLFLFNM